MCTYTNITTRGIALDKLVLNFVHKQIQCKHVFTKHKNIAYVSIINRHLEDSASLKSQKGWEKQVQIVPPQQKTLTVKVCSLWERLYHL